MARLRPRRNPAAPRICFVTDVHGSDRCFKKFLNAGKFYGVQHLILGGDITGKTMVPIERTARGWTAAWGDHRYVDIDNDEKRELVQRIHDAGQYAVCGEHDELLELFSEERRDQTFSDAIVAQMRKWMELADDRLAGSGIRCFVTPGNDDFWEIDEVLRGATAVEFVEGRTVQLDDDHEMLTTGYSNITPWRTPRELDEDALRDRIDQMYQDVSNPDNLIVVLHPPPYGSELDQAPEIDAEFRVQTTGGSVNYASVGSTAVRDFIAEREPLLGLHGHVHESKAAQLLGRTLCINPGSEYNVGVLNCALVTLPPGKPPEHQFTSG
jgi:uncharacterized protein